MQINYRTVLRESVPVDDTWHTLPITGDVVHVACRTPDRVDVWFIHNPAAPADRQRTLRVYGTAHSVPDDAAYVGTALTPPCLS